MRSDQIADKYFKQSIFSKFIFSVIFGLFLTLIMLAGMIHDKSIEYIDLCKVFFKVSLISIILQLLASFSPGILDLANVFKSRGNLIQDSQKKQIDLTSIFISVLLIHFIIFIVFFLVVLTV